MQTQLSFNRAASDFLSNMTANFVGNGDDLLIFSNGLTLELSNEQIEAVNTWANKMAVAKKIASLVPLKPTVSNLQYLVRDYDLTGNETQDEIEECANMEQGEQHTLKLQAQYD